MSGKRARPSSAGDAAFDPNAWRTDIWLLVWMRSRWNIVADVAASSDNAIAERFITEQINALDKNWRVHFNLSAGDWVFCNPPYGKKNNGESRLKIWTQKCCAQAEEQGVNVLLLVPAPNGQRNLWGRYVYGKAKEIYDIDGRLAFRHPVSNKVMGHTNFGVQLIVYDTAKIAESKRSGIPFETVIKPLYQPQ